MIYQSFLNLFETIEHRRFSFHFSISSLGTAIFAVGQIVVARAEGNVSICARGLCAHADSNAYASDSAQDIYSDVSSCVAQGLPIGLLLPRVSPRVASPFSLLFSR